MTALFTFPAPVCTPRLGRSFSQRQKRTPLDVVPQLDFSRILNAEKPLLFEALGHTGRVTDANGSDVAFLGAIESPLSQGLAALLPRERA